MVDYTNLAIPREDLRWIAEQAQAIVAAAQVAIMAPASRSGAIAREQVMRGCMALESEVAMLTMTNDGEWMASMAEGVA